ncbi:GTPase-activating protein [Coemansia sp. RSA 1285]|nr:GTPase-activating protein [Coemansia sp. RSA 1285]
MTEVDLTMSKGAAAETPKVKKSLRSKRLMRPGATTTTNSNSGGGGKASGEADDVTSPTATTVAGSPPSIPSAPSSRSIPAMSLAKEEAHQVSDHSILPSHSLLTPETDKADGQQCSDKLKADQEDEEEEEDKQSVTDTETLLAAGNGTGANSLTTIDNDDTVIGGGGVGHHEANAHGGGFRLSMDTDSKITTTSASSLLRRSSDEDDNFVEADDGHPQYSSMGAAVDSPSPSPSRANHNNDSDKKAKEEEEDSVQSPDGASPRTPSYSADASRGLGAGAIHDDGKEAGAEQESAGHSPANAEPLGDAAASPAKPSADDNQPRESRSLLDYFEDTAEASSPLEPIQEDADLRNNNNHKSRSRSRSRSSSRAGDNETTSPAATSTSESPLRQPLEHGSDGRRSPGENETESDLVVSPPSVAELEATHAKAANSNAVGRSKSLRFGAGAGAEGAGGDASGAEGRRRPTEVASPGSAAKKKGNRRSIMLTSFVPPVSNPASGSPSRSSGESSRSETTTSHAGAHPPANGTSADAANGVVEITIGGKTFHRSSMLDGQLASANGGSGMVPPPASSSIRLRPSNDVAGPSLSAAGLSGSAAAAAGGGGLLGQDSPAKGALQSIGERIGVLKERSEDSAHGDNSGKGNTPDWVKEVQRRKREAQERDEAVKAERLANRADDQHQHYPAQSPAGNANGDDDDEVPLTEISLDDSSENGSDARDPKSGFASSAASGRDKPLPPIEPQNPAERVPATNADIGGSSRIPPIQEARAKEEEDQNEEMAEQVSPSPSAASARSIYRSLSASLGIGQQQQQKQQQAVLSQKTHSKAASDSISQPPPPQQQQPSERIRSTSQTTANSSSSPAAANSQGGLFAAVSSFFGRSSIQQSTPPSASVLSTPDSRESREMGGGMFSPMAASSGAVGKGTIEFPGMRPSNSEARPLPQLPPRPQDKKEEEEEKSGASEMDSLLHQLEAQNQQILKDNKARVFTRETLDEAAEDRMAGSNGSGSRTSESEESRVDWDFWGNLINNYEKTTRAEPRRLAQMIYAGVPKAVRGTVWQVMSGSRNDSALGATFRRLVAQKSEADSAGAKHEKQIKHDLARTFPKLDYFRDTDGAGQEGLFNVLRAYALFDVEVGYCQGLSFVVGPLLLNMPDEEAFGVLVRLMYRYGLRGHFLPTMDDLQLRLFQFEHAFRETLPRLAAHFQAQGVEHTMYVSQWLMTMFAYRLPIQLTFRLFDVVFAEGLDSLLRFAIAVLRRSQTRLLSLGFEAILQYLNEGPLFAFYSHAAPDMLVRDANQVTAVNARYLAKLRRQYIEETQRRIEAEDEGNRIRSENERLKLENQGLRGSAQKMTTAHIEAKAELERNRAEADRLAKLVSELEAKLKVERMSAEDTVRDELDQLARKNVQLNVKNQQLEDSLQDLEAALIQIKMLYAESEDQRETMTKKFEDLRRALH